MMFTHSARIIADSISSSSDVRITTLEVVMPRIVLAEFNTHRVFSRNSASSRAIPVQKMLDQVVENPYVPDKFLANQKGMQAGDAIEDQDSARAVWLEARDEAVRLAAKLLELGVHKQTTNRLLEPFMWHTVVVTATEWSNFFHLRDNLDAHPDIQKVAAAMKTAMENSTPRRVDRGEWHLPFVREEDFVLYGTMVNHRWLRSMPAIEPLAKLSIARCARVSYLTHDGRRDVKADFDLFDRLLNSGHLSPFEHAAMATRDGNTFSGNFRGWIQYRKLLPNEADILNKDFVE